MMVVVRARLVCAVVVPHGPVADLVERPTLRRRWEGNCITDDMTTLIIDEAMHTVICIGFAQDWSGEIFLTPRITFVCVAIVPRLHISMIQPRDPVFRVVIPLRCATINIPTNYTPASCVVSMLGLHLIVDLDFK